MIGQNGIIELEGMVFKAYHGCLEHEKTAGNIFTVDFKGELPMDKARESDCLEDALDYGLVYNCIKRQMAIHSDLLEHLTGRIVESVAAEFPQLESFTIRVSKQRPPVDGIAQWSRVTMKFHKN